MSTDPDTPSLSNRASFVLRSHVLKTLRLISDARSPARRWPMTANVRSFSFVVAESISPLRLGHDETERVFLRGKLENLRQACRRLNGITVPAGQVFSFWKQVGPPWWLRGFVTGLETREVGLMPSMGGGLSQLAQALFQAANECDLRILERHPGASGERNISVTWNHRDFRFLAPEQMIFIEARMTPDELIVRFRTEKPLRERLSPSRAASAISIENSAVTNSATPTAASVADAHVKTAAILDRHVPEFESYLSGELIDLYLLPGSLERSWYVPAASAKRRAWLTSFLRSTYSLWAKRRGQISAETRLKTAEWLAEAFMKRLPYDVEHLIVSQDFLPFLWRLGAFQGRSFDVLLTRPALNVIHDRLEMAHELMPSAAALVDYRAPQEIVEAEAEALVYAERVITPHEDFARVYPNLRKLEWEKPSVVPPADVRRPQFLLFPSSLATREGAQAALKVAEYLKLPLLVVGRDLENLAGAEVAFISEEEIPWHEVAAVVHPTLFESWPRLHLQALALEIPVVCTEFTGLEESKLVTHVTFGDQDELRRALERALQREGDPSLDEHLEAIHAAEAVEEVQSSVRLPGAPVPLVVRESVSEPMPRETSR